MSRARHSGGVPEPGDVVGRWRLVAALGSGGMATVWRAEAVDGGEDVALKILHQTRITTEETRRMRREYLTLIRLDHPHIVKVFDAGQHDGFPYLALQYVAGQDLGQLLERWKLAEPTDRFARAERITRELCEALSYVHARGIIHRDMKPGNVLIGHDGHAWLTDFGVVKDVESFNTNLTMAGRLVGTVAFMAPEQITGDPVDSRADLYGLGALLYAMLTGRRPVIADTIAGYLARQLAEMPKSPVEVDSRVPPRLDRLCMRLLQKDPGQRFATAAEVLAALDTPESHAELPMHGRDGVVERVEARLQALGEGVGGALAIVGPRGSGRSRCLREVAARAAQRGLVVSPPAAAAEAQVLLVDDVHLLTAPALAPLVARMERALGENPALMVFVSAAPLPTAVQDLAEVVPVEELTLEPLDREGVRSLLRDRGVSGGLGAALTRRLAGEVGGWPGPLVEQFDTLIAEGWLARNGDGSVRASRPIDHIRTDPLPLPASERAGAFAASSALEPDARGVLEAAAVLAMPASVGVLGATAGLADASRAVEALARAGLVNLKTEGLQELVELTSSRLGQAVCEALPAERLRALHGAAATALRERYGRGGGAIAELIAHHLVSAGTGAEARPLLVGAAQSALRRGDASHARLLAERALALEGTARLPDAVEETKLCRLARSVLGDALRASGRLRKALECWTSALALGGAGESERARLLVSGALAGIALGDAAAAEGDLLNGLVRLPQGDALWVEATHAAAELSWGRGDRAGAVSRWHALAGFAAETRNTLAGILADAGLLLVQTAPGPHTLNAWSALYQRAQRFGRPGTLASVAAQLGRAALEVGELARVASLADELAELGERREWPEVAALGSALHAATFAAAGDGPGAARAARDALAAVMVEEARQGHIAAIAVRAWSSVEDAGEAAKWLVADCFPPTPPYDAEGLRQSCLALAWQRSRPDDAVEAARVAVSRPLLSVSGGAWVRMDAARVLRRLGHPVEAAAAVKGLDGLLRTNGLVGLVGRLGEG